MKELEIVDKILERNIQQFSKIYPFTTENIKGYMGNLDLTDKRVLTVCSSGDHILNTINNGATEIDSFDINLLSYQYFLLKEAAIKSLFYQEYLDYFCTLSLLEKKSYYSQFDLKLYKKIRKNLTLKSRNFWDEINKMSAQNKIFSKDVYSRSINIQTNQYLDEHNYKNMKYKISNAHVSFQDRNLKNLGLNKKYDYIFLSNIAQYSINNTEEDYKKFMIVIFNLLNKLNDNGKIYLNYFYDYDYNQMCYTENMPIILNDKLFNDYFDNIVTKKFDSMNKFKYNIDTKDAVKILTK